MDGWANEWIIWKYAPTLRMGRASGGVKKKVKGMRMEGGYLARLLQSAPCQKVSDFGTWGMFVIIIISPGEAAHFSQSSRLGVGVGSGGGVSGCCCTLHSWTGGRTGLETFMNYGCQFFLRCCVLRPGEEALSLALIFWKYFSAHSTISFLAFSLSSLRWRLEGLGLGLLFAFFSLEHVLSSF